MKRIIILAAVLCGLSVPAQAQLTPAPFVLQQYFNNSGDPAYPAGLCTFAAGTSTLSSSYTTAAGTVANANPLLLDVAGRPSSNGFFLVPGTSYKIILYDFTNAVAPYTCSVGMPGSGSAIWTQDNIAAVPSSSANIDITLAAGVSFTAGELAYISDGSGSLNAGQAYKADADFSYAGALPFLAFAVNNTAAGANGAFRIAGTITGLTGLTTGQDYYASSTAGAITATQPLMARLVGRATSATTIQIQPNPRSTPIKPRAPCGRLTPTSNLAVTTSDVTAATTVYFTPYGGCSDVTFYNGSNAWYLSNFSQVSIAVPSTTNTAYDVFLYDSSGTPTIELQSWNSLTTRHAAGIYATLLPKQDGVFVKSTNGTTVDATRLYLGSFRTTGVSGTTESSGVKRYIWNYYNRVPMELKRFESTASWTYNTSTWRQANAAAANQVEAMIGVSEDQMRVAVSGAANNANAPIAIGISIGLDSTSAVAANTDGGTAYVTAGNTPVMVQAEWVGAPAIGSHTWVWIERVEVAAGASTLYGENQPTGFGEHHGILGWVKG